MLSPTKNAEYWANGLPILLTEGIADDSDLIKQFNLGANFELNKRSIENAFNKISNLLSNNSRTTISEFALNYRDRTYIKKVYNNLF